jgi:hypothetical protein
MKFCYKLTATITTTYELNANRVAELNRHLETRLYCRPTTPLLGQYTLINPTTLAVVFDTALLATIAPGEPLEAKIIRTSQHIREVLYGCEIQTTCEISRAWRENQSISD